MFFRYLLPGGFRGRPSYRLPRFFPLSRTTPYGALREALAGGTVCDMGTHDKPPPQPDPSSDGRPPPGQPLPPPPDPGKHSKPDPPDKGSKK